MNPSTFAHRPIIDAMDLHEQWYLLLIPMAFFIAVAYRAVRTNSLEGFWRGVLFLTVQILLGMAALALALWLLAEVYVRAWMNA